MKRMSNYLIEKLKIDKNIENQDTFKFDINGFKNEIDLPFKIKIKDSDEVELIYNIEKRKIGNNYYWILLNEYDKCVVYFNKTSTIEFFKDKNPIICTIHYLGKTLYSRYETIKLVN